MIMQVLFLYPGPLNCSQYLLKSATSAVTFHLVWQSNSSLALKRCCSRPLQAGWRSRWDVVIGVIAFVFRLAIPCQAPTLLLLLLYFSPAPVSPQEKESTFRVLCFQSMGVEKGSGQRGGNGLHTLINSEQAAWPSESDDTLA